MTDGTWVGRARCKINLRLQILGRRPSGYHDIDTVFQTLELADEVTLTPREGEEVSIEVEGVPDGSLGSPDENLAVIAANRFRETAHRSGAGRPGVHIRLRKHVPHGAGLGGGSSDAAAVLRGMNELAGGSLGREELLEIGSGIGSDVAFFVADVPRARGVGRGEQLERLDPLPSRPVVLLFPTEPVSTAWAYAALVDARRASGVVAPKGDIGIDVPSDWPSTASDALNDFEDVLFPLRPELRGLRDSLAEAGAELAMLSGSGSAVFGVFRSEEDADDAIERLESNPSPAWVRMLRTSTSE